MPSRRFDASPPGTPSKSHATELQSEHCAQAGRSQTQRRLSKANARRSGGGGGGRTGQGGRRSRLSASRLLVAPFPLPDHRPTSRSFPTRTACGARVGAGRHRHKIRTVRMERSLLQGRENASGAAAARSAKARASGRRPRREPRAAILLWCCAARTELRTTGGTKCRS